MASNKEQKLKIAILVLSVLLAISLSALVWMIFYYGRLAPAVVTDNVITTGSVEGTSALGKVIPEAHIVARDTEILTTKFGSETIDEDGILELYRGQPYDSDPFVIDNMFPGDTFEHEYRVEVSQSGPVQVNFRVNVNPTDLMANITDADEKAKYILDDVLECKIWIDNGNGYELKYGGSADGDLMRDMDDVLSCWTANTRGTTHVDYKIEVSLDTSVGNKYQDTKMIGEFIWWVEVEQEKETNPSYDRPDKDYEATPDKETTAPEQPTETVPEMSETEPFEPGELVNPPKTGDDTILIMGITLIAGLFIIILLIGRRRKEDGHES